MITWILGTILIIYCLIRRFSKDGRVEGYPLGMPRGTVRAIITLMIVSFPFNYLFSDSVIPGIIVSAIFILIAFYFEARKGQENKIKLIKKIKNPEKAAKEKKKEKKPLYLPKYSVRILLMTILLIFFIIDRFQSINLEVTNTLTDILVIAILYFIGTFFRTIGLSIQKKELKKQIEEIPNYQELSKYEILDKVIEQKRGGITQFGKSLISILTFIAVTTALILFDMHVDYAIIFDVELRIVLLLVVNLYYGFRD